MLHSRSHLAITAVLAASLPLLPAAAQTAHSTVPHAGAHRGALHGTTSVHPTPKRQHMLEQQRAFHARRGGGAQHDADRLNEQSLQRVQQGGNAAPAGSDAGPGPAAAPGR